MVKGKATIKKPLDHFAIRSTSERVQVNDTVLMRNENSGKPSYIGKVEKMWIDGRNNQKVQVRWYYRPEETIAGRREFHGAKEVFLSDHIDIQSVETIEGKCYVHTFKSYTQLPNVSPKDFFCRFTYEAATGVFLPDRVAVYCICEMPYNPDDLMMQCQTCKNWFHPACLGMTIEQARKLHQFYCKECSINMASNDLVKTAISDSKSVLDKRQSCFPKVVEAWKILKDSTFF